MRILFDHSTPRGLVRHLAGHDVTTAKQRGWDQLTNGDLVQTADSEGFDLLLTADKNLRYQQNLSGRRIALVVLGKSPWPVVRLQISAIIAAVNAAQPREFHRNRNPPPAKKAFQTHTVTYVPSPRHPALRHNPLHHPNPPA